MKIFLIYQGLDRVIEVPVSAPQTPEDVAKLFYNGMPEGIVRIGNAAVNTAGLTVACVVREASDAPTLI